MYKENLKFLLCFLIIFNVLIPALAKANEKVEAYKNYQSIPQALVNGLRADTFIEVYISETLQFIRRFSGDKQILEQASIDQKIESSVKQARKEQVAQLIGYDSNQDGSVTLEEVKIALIEKKPQYAEPQFTTQLDEMLKNVMDNDHDGDGTVSYKEMWTLSEDAKNNIAKYRTRGFSRAKGYLALDPNKDGELTIQELKILARKAFYTVDVNKDTHISREEFLNFQEVYKSSITSACSFGELEIPDNLKVYGIGANSGRLLDYQIDQSGHQATQIDIVVNEPANPVALILGAYEPTIWNISHTPNTKIHAVVAGGYHKLVFSGLEKSVPALVNTRQDKGPCGYFYFSSNKIEKLNPLARSIFKKPADMFFSIDQSGQVIIGEKNFNPAQLIRSNKNPPESYKLKGTLLAGEAGLAEAVRKGIIRKATEVDRQAWIDKLIKREKQKPTKDLPPMAGGDSLKASLSRMRFHNAYVVLKDFIYPAGLYGGNSATFIIPEGVNMPKGKPGHSYVYDHNSLKCIGAGCNPR